MILTFEQVAMVVLVVRDTHMAPVALVGLA